MNDTRFARRGLLAALAMLGAAGAFPKNAQATLLRGLTLDELVGQAEHVLVTMPLGASCRELVIGGRRWLVTETRVVTRASLGPRAPRTSELTVRTLGGTLGDVGEFVDGQAEFVAGVTCVAFLQRAPDGALWVSGMAQGHYPLQARAKSEILMPSPHLPRLQRPRGSASQRLAGTTLTEAERLITSVRSR